MSYTSVKNDIHGVNAVRESLVERDLSPSNSSSGNSSNDSLNTTEYDMLQETFRIHREMIHEMKQRHRESVHNVKNALIRRGDRKLRLIGAVLEDGSNGVRVSPRIIKALTTRSPSSSPPISPRLNDNQQPRLCVDVYAEEESDYLHQTKQLDDSAFDASRVPSPEYFDAFEIDLRLMEELSFEDFFYDCMPIPESGDEEDQHEGEHTHKQGEDDDIPLPQSMDDEEQILMDQCATEGRSSGESIDKSPHSSTDSAVMSLNDLQPFELPRRHPVDDELAAASDHDLSQSERPGSPAEVLAVTSEEEQQIDDILDNLFETIEPFGGSEHAQSVASKGDPVSEHTDRSDGRDSANAASTEDPGSRLQRDVSKSVGEFPLNDSNVPAADASTLDILYEQSEANAILHEFLSMSESIGEDQVDSTTPKNDISTLERIKQDENDFSPPSIASSASGHTSEEQASMASCSTSSALSMIQESSSSSSSEDVIDECEDDSTVDDRISICSPEDDLVSFTSTEQNETEDAFAADTHVLDSSSDAPKREPQENPSSGRNDAIEICSTMNDASVDTSAKSHEPDRSAVSRIENENLAKDESQRSPKPAIRKVAYMDNYILEEEQLDDFLESLLDVADNNTSEDRGDVRAEDRTPNPVLKRAAYVDTIVTDEKELDDMLESFLSKESDSIDHEGGPCQEESTQDDDAVGLVADDESQDSKKDMLEPSLLSPRYNDPNGQLTSRKDLEEPRTFLIDAAVGPAETEAELTMIDVIQIDKISINSAPTQQDMIVQPVPVHSPSRSLSAVNPPDTVPLNVPTSSIALGGLKSVFESAHANPAHGEEEMEASARDLSELPLQDFEAQGEFQDSSRSKKSSRKEAETEKSFTPLPNSKSRITSPDLNVLENSVALVHTAFERPHDPIASALSHELQKTMAAVSTVEDTGVKVAKRVDAEDETSMETPDARNESAKEGEVLSKSSSLSSPDDASKSGCIPINNETSDQDQALVSPPRPNRQEEALEASAETQSPVQSMPSFDQMTVSTMSASPVHESETDMCTIHPSNIPGLEIPRLEANDLSKPKLEDPAIKSPPRPMILSRGLETKNEVPVSPKAFTPPRFDSKLPFSRTNERKDRHQPHHSPRTPHRIATSRSPFRGYDTSDKSIFSSADKSSLRSLRGYYSLASPPRKATASPGCASPKIVSRTPRDRDMSPPAKPLSPAMAATPKSPYHEPMKICVNKFTYNLHPKMGPCHRCWALASSEEQQRFLARGSHLRIVRTRGGCTNTCTIFPPGRNENDGNQSGNDDRPVRLCRQCFFATHQRGGSRLQVYRGNHIKVKATA